VEQALGKPQVWLQQPSSCLGGTIKFYDPSEQFTLKDYCMR